MKNANAVCFARWFGIVLSIVAVAALPVTSGCERKSDTVTQITPKSVADTFDIKVGQKLVRMQIAVRDEEMQRGLMGRRDLGPDDGMLFVYGRPQRMSFWMRNTPTPLDIGFFDPTGKLVEIYPLHPYDETGVSSQSTNLVMALEVNQGWYRANAIKTGAQLDLAALARALEARGFEPEKLGIPAVAESAN